MVTAGAALVMLAGIGVMGALALSSCLLSFYAIVLVVLMTLESAVVVLALVFRSELESKASDVFSERLKKMYGDAIDESRGPFTRTFNTLQAKLSCCGWRGPADFGHIDRYHWNTTLDHGMTRLVPDQCCGDYNTTEVLGCVAQPFYNSSEIHQQGCQDAIKKVIDGYQWSIFGTAVFLLFFQFIVMILTLASIIHNGKVKYEMREVRA
ncbi:tetraspanin [Elysia marginata]|uniref:Tetraspanin n=1 Tax=Elysia marginata TaxID=1093978 RepID=A0AAV4HX47_9GAST|nr:tetraspanin [Elysia marginata]